MVVLIYYYVGCKCKAATWYLKKIQNAPRPASEHPLVRGGKRLGGIKGCKYETSLWHLNGFQMEITLGQQYNIGEKSTVILVVAVFFTLTDRASTIPSNIRGCQFGTWSQRGTKVNGSHHGDNSLLRPTGIQIATRSYATLQAMSPTNINTIHQTSLLPYIESSLDRLGLLSPTHYQRSQQRTGQITFQPVLINKSKFLKATHRTTVAYSEVRGVRGSLLYR